MAPTARTLVLPRGGVARWVTTLIAMFLSTWALDAFATAFGVALVWSRVLRDVPQYALIAVLVATYVAWGVGLRRNLAANWSLLQQTGCSTNALSKAGFDIATRRGVRSDHVRLAASVGYIATEVIKEVPYYVGAVGAAVLADSVGATESLIFLAGANLGACVFECVAAGLTHRFLRQRTRAHATALSEAAGTPRWQAGDRLG